MMANAAPQAIIVLGMHRSGTSALAGALGKFGLRLPARLMRVNQHNPKGYFEPEHIVAIHDRLLQAAGLNWSSIAGMPETWYGSAEARAYVSELAAAVRDDYANADVMVVKDPRMCRLMPLWRMVLDELGAEARFAVPIRHPFEVARSLQTRDALPLAHGCLLWLCHVLAAERETRGARRVFVHFNDLLSDPARIAGDVVSKLVGNGRAPDENGVHDIAALIDPGLRHQVANMEDLHDPATLRPWLADVYEALTALIGDPADRQAMARLDNVNAVFEPAVASFAPLLAASDEKIASLGKANDDKNSRLLQQQDRIAALSRTSEALQDTVAHLKHTIAQLKQTVAALQEQVAAKDQRAAELSRMIDAQTTQIDALNAQAEEIFRSTGWRLLASLRWFGRQRDRLRKARRRT